MLFFLTFLSLLNHSPCIIFPFYNASIRQLQRFCSLPSTLLFATANTSVRYRLNVYRFRLFGRDRTTMTVKGYFF